MSALAADTSLPAQAGAWQREIEEHMYRLYNLTPGEIKIVEDSR